MDRNALRALVRVRRVFCELHALPSGRLRPELEDAIADLVAPGFRERVVASYLAKAGALNRESLSLYQTPE